MSDSSGQNGRIGRLASEAKGLVDDTREWLDAKLRLMELDFEEKIEAMAGKAMASAIVAFFSAMAVVFLMVAGALGLGAWWESNALGFLAMGGILFLAAAMVHWLRPTFLPGSMRVVAGRPRKDRMLQLPGPAHQPPRPALKDSGGDKPKTGTRDNTPKQNPNG
ncbi:MAG: phage holin family protein [Rhodothermales bacterium]|nr:phage holin family protein [Rhodothermales bacterium]MBO6781438.1 phage holin family protein [Rhodothermales bacterium]